MRKPTTRSRISKKCKRCGMTFEIIPARKDKARYCSRACFSNRLESTCEVCGTVFDYPASEGIRRFCRYRCKAESQRMPAPEGMKRCSIGKHFTPKENFGKSTRRLDGLLTHCKPCKKAHIAARPDQYRAYKRAHYARDPARGRAQRQKWVEANPQRIDAARRSYATLNPEKVKESKCRSRAKRKGAIGSHSHSDWLLKVEYFGWRCIYCGRELTNDTLTKDHRIPLSKGGTNFLANLAPACASCNSAKRARSENEFRIKLRSNGSDAGNGVNSVASRAA